jgi:hypothetical protein
MSDDSSRNLAPLHKLVSHNRKWVILFVLLSLVLASMLSIILWVGLDRLNEQIRKSPQYQMNQTKSQLKDMKKIAEAQYAKFREDTVSDPLKSINEELKLNNKTQIDVEADWGIAVDLYSKIINRLTNHLGSIKEWQYFYDQKLAIMISQSDKRREQMPTAKESPTN